tara:strand:- start:9592 stop:10245 length:654 start_codon:yes stop_codon:yes gene_type:complete
MKRYIIFSKQETRIELGALDWASGATSTAVNTYYEADDYKIREKNAELESKSVDLTTLKLKPGEKIYYDKYVPQRLNKTSKKNVLTTVSATTILTGRVTGTTAVGEDANNTLIQNGFVNGYIIREEAVVYSYPIHTYVGAKSKSSNTVSLYFERTAGIIDEVILNIKSTNAINAIDNLQYDFRDEKATRDIIINENSYNKYNSNIIGVSEIISSISI